MDCVHGSESAAHLSGGLLLLRQLPESNFRQLSLGIQFNQRFEMIEYTLQCGVDGQKGEQRSSKSKESRQNETKHSEAWNLGLAYQKCS